MVVSLKLCRPHRVWLKFHHGCKDRYPDKRIMSFANNPALVIDNDTADRAALPDHSFFEPVKLLTHNIAVGVV